MYMCCVSCTVYMYIYIYIYIYGNCLTCVSVILYDKHLVRVSVVLHMGVSVGNTLPVCQLYCIWVCQWEILCPCISCNACEKYLTCVLVELCMGNTLPVCQLYCAWVIPMGNNTLPITVHSPNNGHFGSRPRRDVYSPRHCDNSW